MKWNEILSNHGRKCVDVSHQQNGLGKWTHGKRTTYSQFNVFDSYTTRSYAGFVFEFRNHILSCAKGRCTQIEFLTLPSYFVFGMERVFHFAGLNFQSGYFAVSIKFCYNQIGCNANQSCRITIKLRYVMSM